MIASKKGRNLQNSYSQHFQKRKQVSRDEQNSAMSLSKRKSNLPSKRNNRKRKPFPVGALISCIVLLIAFIYAFENEEKIVKSLSKIEISVFGKAKAQGEPTKKAPKPKSTLDKFSDEKEAKKVAKKTWTDEEIALFTQLEQRKSELDQREENLKKLEVELKQQQEDIKKNLAELRKIRTKISQGLEQKIEKDEEKVDKLVAVYSNMKPQQAAKVMEKIDEELAIRVLAKMKKKSAAEVLNLLEPEKAKRLSEKYVGYISMN